jgi:hypothetical protein
MTEFDRPPGAIDDPGMKGGIDPDLDRLPASDGTNGIGGSAEIPVQDLDLPGPDDPVAWSYVEADALVVGPAGTELGRVAAMLGAEAEDIFHGVAVTTYHDGAVRVVPADAVVRLTSARVEIAYDTAQLDEAEEYRPIPV